MKKKLKKSKVFIALTLVFALMVSVCSAATYTVKKGDNLWSLSKRFGVTIQDIVDANDAIKDPNLIYIDQVLTIPQADTISGVKTIGFVDTDGAKASAIVVEYNVDMTGADVSLDDYVIDNYAIAQASKCEIGSHPGAAIGISVDGSKVIIELNTDYQMGSVANPYQLAMYAGVKQVNDIKLADGSVIKASDTEVVNYTVVEKQGRNGVTYNNIANEGAYTIEGIEGYQIFTKEAGTAFHATNCFEEATGEYIDVDLPYALYVPEDYDASKEYAVVLHIHDAGFLGDDPMITLTEAQGPYNFASDEVQQLLKDQGLGGLIVVAPQINGALRSTRDNWTTSAAVPATWQLMDHITETYNIDSNRIYATGQSMGAMQVLEMAAERDNYFAGILPIGCQWGTNYNKESDYQGAVYYTAPADGKIIWTMDADGNPCDYRNWFYMISDDNILLLNCVGDTFSTGAWKELVYLYSDLADAQFPRITWNPLTLTQEQQNAKLEELLAMDSDLGFYWGAFEGGNHMATWIYGHGVTAAYDWLFTQTRESEMAREKLDLDKPFELADEQIKTEDRVLSGDVYYLTGKLGAGTADYNTTTYAKAGKLYTYPNWKPATAVVGVTTEGFVDIDGAKISKVIVEYGMDMTGADITADTYEIVTNAKAGINNGNGQPGDIINITIDGSKVVLEVYTDYLCSSEQVFNQAMAAGVIQKADIKVGDVTIAASETEYKNYEAVESVNFRGQTVVNNTAVYGTYTIEGIEGFKFYTNIEGDYPVDGPAYHVEDCFDEKTGEVSDFDVSYALYVPEDWHADGDYAMVVVDNPAANDGTHPLQSVLETRSPALLASEFGQNLVKENHGLDGLIVVVPVVQARVDDNACTPGQYEALVALWDYIQEEYSVNENHVYGIGQSVGGMVLMETNRNRDNYFAGILMFENQWAQNYYKDGLFIRNQASDAKTAATAPWHYPRTDADITWDYYYDTEGNKVYEDHDPYNLYYLVSDDNIMVMNRSNNNLSNNTWRELSFLYSDLVGYSIDQCLVDGKASIEEQEAAIEAYLASGNTYGDQEMGLYWVTFEGGSNGYSARKVDSGYEWLLAQSREDTMAREKLDVNKPFEIADEQIQDESRVVKNFTNPDGSGEAIYYLTAKGGAGTQNYNTSWLNLSKIADAVPGWLPEGMSWETGVEVAKMEGVTAIQEDGKLTAVAIEYNVDMKDIVVNLKGNPIIGFDGNVREDIEIAIDPYIFYDAAGNEIACAIKNVYVNDSASVVAGAARESGQGNYVIVEIDTTSDASVVGVMQRTSIRTNTAFATATAEKVYPENYSVTIRTNGKVAITDEKYSHLFDSVSLADLVAAGAVKVNDTAVDGKNVPINGANALWQNEDGTWSWKTHIMHHGENVSYEQASVDFVVGLSKLRGPFYTVTVEDGKAVGIEFSVYDGAMAETVTVGDKYTTVTVCGEGDKSMLRANPSTIQFPNELLEADSEGNMPADQCLIIYWQDAEGWHLKRADSKQVTVPATGYTYTDSLLNLEYSESWNRPTQPIQAIKFLGEESAEMIQWFYCDGITSAFSRADAKTDLLAAIVKAEAALASVKVSEDGTDVPDGEMWVTQYYHDTFAQLINDVKAVAAEDDLLNTEYEEALYGLALAYGANGGRYGKGGNVFSDGIGFMTFAKAHLGTK